jgi:hypothetical protein
MGELRLDVNKIGSSGARHADVASCAMPESDRILREQITDPVQNSWRRRRDPERIQVSRNQRNRLDPRAT